MKATLDIDPAILNEARIVAQQKGKDPGEIISEWALLGLAKISLSQFPAFDVPKNTIVNVDVIQRLISDEGLSS